MPNRASQSAGRLVGLGAAAPRGAEPEGDVVERAQVREQRLVLEDEADVAVADQQRRLGPGRSPASDRSTRARGRTIPASARSSVRLAGAVGTDHGDDVAGVGGRARRRSRSGTLDVHPRAPMLAGPVAHGVASQRLRSAARIATDDEQQDHAQRRGRPPGRTAAPGRSASASSGWCPGSCRRR